MEHKYMGKFKGVFTKIKNAEDLGGSFNRLGLGTHTVVLEQFGVRPSKKDKGAVVYSDWYVQESTTHEVGETRTWAWLPEAPGYYGKYEQERSKHFLETVAACIGDTRETDDIGDELTDDDQHGRGLMLRVEIAESRKTDDEGKPYTDITWYPIEQTVDDIQAMREELDKIKPLKLHSAVEEPPARTNNARPQGRAAMPAQGYQKPAGGLAARKPAQEEEQAPPPAKPAGGRLLGGLRR